MAKKGGVQQLQADIATDEDFEKLLERPGLLVLDVYSEWCGPCLGMVGSLRKIKLEVGGDNLQLAVCKADTISSLSRFRRKSEPIWLFVAHGKAVNIMFGTDVPKLIKMIINELELTLAKATRITYEITELQPIELEQLTIKMEADALAARIEREALDKQRLDYLHHVTDIIMENMPDMGITMFGPQVNRDMFKKLSEPAELLKMQCKDRRVMPVTKEDFATVNFACENPLSADVIEHLHEKELLMCFWKVDETLGYEIPGTLLTYEHELTKETVVPAEVSNDDGDSNGEQDDATNDEAAAEADNASANEENKEPSTPPQVIPPIITHMELLIEVEMEIEEEQAEQIEEEEAEADVAAVDSTTSNVMADEEEQQQTDEEATDATVAATEAEAEAETDADATIGEPSNVDTTADDANDNVEAEQESVATSAPAVEQIAITVPKPRQTYMKTIKIPPIWVPNNRRTQAALIYVFFRGQTTAFLPTDPIPEPPHVIMAFDAYKKKDLINLIEKYKEDIPLYGFFSSDKPADATLLANSVEKYNMKSPLPTDKMILKVNKSDTMQLLLTYGPSYVSINTVIGHEESLKFFPPNYVSALQEQEQLQAAVTGKPKKRKKNKKSVDPEKRDNGAQEDTANSGDAEKNTKTTPEEGVVSSTSSGEDSGESRPQSAEGAGESSDPTEDKTTVAGEATN